MNENLVQIDQRIGSYKLEKKIGAGANSEVWLATKLSDKKQVALKVLSDSLNADNKHMEIFQSEMNISSKIRHPGIVTAFDAGVKDGLCYLAMEYIDGIELAEHLQNEKIIPEGEALKIILDIAELLKMAWKNLQLVHRDIKPANIMLSKNGTTKLMDVGIAKSAREIKENNSTIAIGTPKFMSPEQAINKGDIDFKSDIYALGVTLYIMLTGKPPFDDEDPLELIRKKIKEELPNPKEINNKISDGTCELLKIMLEKNKENRQDSWKDVIRDIRSIANGNLPVSKLSQEEKSAIYAKKSQLHLERLNNMSKDEKYREKGDDSFSVKQLLIALAIVGVLILCAIYYVQTKQAGA